MAITIDHLVRSRRKTIALIIQPSGALTIRAPLRMSDEQIKEFAYKHAEWIHKKQTEAKASPPLQEKQFVDGETFLYLGKEYPLAIVTRQRPALTFNGNKFLLTYSNIPITSKIFQSWYKAQAQVVISKFTTFRAKQNKFKFLKIRISSARTRWGSCSGNGTLSFTWRLVLAPPEILDYVVVHELVHTQIRNHSKAFWKKVGEIKPGYKNHIRWLKQNGKYLTL